MEVSGYELSRNWFDFCFENPEKAKPNHTALYFFIVEHCNRLGWKSKFGLPTTMAMEAIGIKSYNTYKKTLDDLIEFGFIDMIEKSKNQYSSNIIALSNFNKALDKALDKAMIKHTSKQSESTHQSIDSIFKHITKNIEQLTLEQIEILKNKIIEIDKKEIYSKESKTVETEIIEKTENDLEYERFNKWIDENAPYVRKIKNQITQPEYFRLTEIYSGEQIKEILSAISNYKDSPKKYTSVNLTLRKWAAKEYSTSKAKDERF